MFKGKKVLVTGGTGMIGIQVVRQLLEKGANVRVASLDAKSRAEKEVEFISGNLLEWESCKRAVEGMDYVFHLAGIKGSVAIGGPKAATFLVPLLLMNTSMMEAARQADVERFLYTSSIGVYHPVELLVEDQAWDGPPHEADKFGAWAKRMGELQAEAYKIQYGWDAIAIVRPANVYGPYDNFDPESALVVPALIERVAKGEDPLIVWGDGSVIRDFIYSRDCAEGMILALENGANCTPVNLGSGVGTTIKELVEAVVSNFERPPEVQWDADMPSGQPIRLMDMTRARDMIGFTAKTTIQQGVKETVEWYLEHNSTSGERYNVFQLQKFI